MSSKKPNTVCWLYRKWVCLVLKRTTESFTEFFLDFYWTMDPLPKVSSVPRPARKSLEPSPAAWTRNLPQIYSEYWCKLGDSSRSRCDRRCDRFSAAIWCIAVAVAASGAGTAAAPCDWLFSAAIKVSAAIRRYADAIISQQRRASFYCFPCFPL